MIKTNFSIFLYYLQVCSIIILISSLLTCKFYVNSQTQIKRSHLRLETLTHYAHFLMLEASSTEIESFAFSKPKNLYTFYWAEYSDVPHLENSSEKTFGSLSQKMNFSKVKCIWSSRVSQSFSGLYPKPRINASLSLSNLPYKVSCRRLIQTPIQNHTDCFVYRSNSTNVSVASEFFEQFDSLYSVYLWVL